MARVLIIEDTADLRLLYRLELELEGYEIIAVGSGMGLYYTLFVIPFILPFYYWDKQRQEQVIRASSLDWVIVQPGALTNGSKRGVYRHGGDIGNWLWTVRISRADVADFMLNQLADDTYLRAAPGVCW